MKTPIVDFLNGYATSSPVRMHMPGHKGDFGYERDLTEISGADSLYHASGIILESEKYSGGLFSADTFYSTEGSSLSIRAMLSLAMLYAAECGKAKRVIAARNVHRSFVSAAALLDIDVEFFGIGDYLSSKITPTELEKLLSESCEMPVAVYLTSPDYLGRMQDIRGISEVCKRHGVLLLVDNAHGAYLAFLEKSEHPISLGADMCADSAHKTLPALTGASYLHINKGAPKLFKENAKSAMALFGSTSPSYLILESLDRLNAILADGFGKSLNDVVRGVGDLKRRLCDIGYEVIDGEPMKITISARSYGYLGTELSAALEDGGVYPEFCDSDYLVLMPSACTKACELERVFEVLSALPRRDALMVEKITLDTPKRAMSIRAATLAPRERVAVDSALGRILADSTVACPPAVPILVSGEVINEDAIKAFKYYGYDEIQVVK